jgi:uncharacterized membrane protein (UPF0182 family)
MLTPSAIAIPTLTRGENDFNYIRNSVKVVVDAYNGAVGST